MSNYMKHHTNWYSLDYLMDHPEFPELEQLRQNVLMSPDDDSPRLIISDWLEERGETERAEFIREGVADPDTYESVFKIPDGGNRPLNMSHVQMYCVRGFVSVLELPTFVDYGWPFRHMPITSIIYADHRMTIPLSVIRPDLNNSLEFLKFRNYICNYLYARGCRYGHWMQAGLSEDRQWWYGENPTGMTDRFVRHHSGLGFNIALMSANPMIAQIHRMFTLACVDWHREQWGLPPLPEPVPII